MIANIIIAEYLGISFSPTIEKLYRVESSKEERPFRPDLLLETEGEGEQDVRSN